MTSSSLADRILATGLLQRPEGATVPEIVEGLRAAGDEPWMAMHKVRWLLPRMDDVKRRRFWSRDRWPVWSAPGGQG